MQEEVHISDFRSAQGPILDVRSPGEFEHGHIPGAHNIPIFNDEERAKIGICYKQTGSEDAIRLGLDIAGPKLESLVRSAAEIAPEYTVRIHCWRGGMRSKSMAWLMRTVGFRVLTLEGGYKSYRRWARGIFSMSRSVLILGGLTGTGKTSILKALEEAGEQVLDLEGFANHRGSSFGGLGMPPQPSTQHFENLIAERLAAFDRSRAVWIESESGRVGRCWVPEELYNKMKSAPVIQIVRPIEERLDILTKMYHQTDFEFLIEATERIRKSLGGERTRAAVDLLRQNDSREACRIILDYYDRSYREDLKRRPFVLPAVDVGGLSDGDAAKLIENASRLIPMHALTTAG